MLVRAVLDRVVDAEVDLEHLRRVLSLERLLLDEPYNLLERQGVAVELTVQNCAPRQTVDLGANVVHMRERLARAREEPLTRDGEAADAVQLTLGVARELDVLAALVVVVREHRVGNDPRVLSSLGVLLSARRRLCPSTSLWLCGRHLLRHATRLSLLLPVTLRLVDRLLNRRGLVLLADVLTHSDEAGVLLKLTAEVAVGCDDSADALFVGYLNRPHLDFTRGRLAVQGGKGGNSRHCFAKWMESIWMFCTRLVEYKTSCDDFNFFQAI